MADEPTAPAPNTIGVQALLQALAKVLRESRPLGPEAQQALAELFEELGNTLGPDAVPPAQVTHLAESTAHLIHALDQKHDEGVLAAARHRLEQAIVGAETHAPFVAGLARRLLDALANVGI
jgi:hypothetical protein